MRPHLEDLELGPMGSPSLAPGSYRWEPARRRVRAMLGDVAVVDSARAMLLLEAGHLPVYYVPREDVRSVVLEPSARPTHSPLKGTAAYWHMRVGERLVEDAAWAYPQPHATGPDVAGYLAFYWDKMDAWYEEEERVYAHARDPYVRVDVLPTARCLRVLLGGQTVVESQWPRLLLETGMPARYYVPAEDVRMDLLEASATRGRCPYKGEGVFWTARIGGQTFEDIAWSYPTPLPEALHIAGLLCFYGEQVDATILDGTELLVPVTPWAKRPPGTGALGEGRNAVPKPL